MSFRESDYPGNVHNAMMTNALKIMDRNIPSPLEKIGEREDSNGEG